MIEASTGFTLCAHQSICSLDFLELLALAEDLLDIRFEDKVRQVMASR